MQSKKIIFLSIFLVSIVTIKLTFLSIAAKNSLLMEFFTKKPDLIPSKTVLDVKKFSIKLIETNNNTRFGEINKISYASSLICLTERIENRQNKLLTDNRLLRQNIKQANNY